MIFRGINKITNTWAYGDLYQHYEQTFIMQHDGKTCEVFRDTVGQSSGAKDEKGDDIFVYIFPPIEPNTEFHEGELVLYQNGSRFEIGEIQRIVSDGAFVYYHEGDTAAKTPFDCLRKIVNAYTIKETSLGSKRKAMMTCPKCGKKCATLFEEACIECVFRERYGEGEQQ